LLEKLFFLSEKKFVDGAPSEFCMLLRKNLEGKFLDSIVQLEPERILKFSFKTKNEERNLYLEFFGKGNVILCNENDIIIDCLIHHKFKNRTMFPKESYKYPSMEHNLFDIKKDQLSDLLKNSKKDKIVISFATELGLGGVYSEEVCLLSNIDKSTVPKKINNTNILKIINSIKEIINKKFNPKIIYKDTRTSSGTNSVGKEAIDVVPIDLELYKDNEKKEFSSYSEALEEYFTHELKLARKKDSPYAKKIKELKWIIGEQEATLKSLKVKETESREKGELIYNNYQLIKEILDEINKASKKYSWREIKEKLKGHKIIKDVDVKEKSVVVEID